MKKVLGWRVVGLLCLLLLRVGGVWGQAVPTWQWASSSGQGTGNCLVADQTGALYVAGSFTGTATFGTTVLTTSSTSYPDGFVAKLGRNGTYQWAVSLQGVQLHDLVVDAGGNVVVTGVFGVFQDTARFGTTTLTSAGSIDMFVARLSSSGTWQWAAQAGGTSYDYAWAVAVNAVGGVVVAGAFHSPTVQFGSTTLTNQGRVVADGFVATLSPTGQWLWATGIGGSGTEIVKSVAVMANGAICVAGAFDSPLVAFNPVSLTSRSGGTKTEAFVARMTPLGAWQWATSAGDAATNTWAVDLMVDSGDNVFIMGSFDQHVSFGAGTVSLTGNSSDAYVAKLDPAGQWQWASSAGGVDHEVPYNLAMDGAGNLYVTGTFTSPTATFGTTTLTNQTVGTNLFTDLFVAKLNPAGQWQWAMSAGGPYNDEGNGITVFANDEVYLTGTFEVTAMFGTIPLSNIVGLEQLYVARLSHYGVGLPEDAATAAFTLAPNPAHHTVRLTGTKAPTAEVVDALGRTVRVANLELRTANLLDLQGLPAGLYVVRCGGQSRRLVVE